MFTGIVTDVGRVVRITPGAAAKRFTIATAYDVPGIDIGASISHAGCCLTVVEKGEGSFDVELSTETLDRTTLGEWREGTRINLERAAKVGDELGGHIVSGHVDGVGTVVSVAEDAGSRRIVLKAPAPLHRFIAEKGSITVEGVSLTVNSTDGQRFGVNIIPHTLAVTTLDQLAPGSRVNLEIDLIARYLARWNETA